MTDLTRAEREALRLTHRSWERRTLVSADPEEALASLVLAVLAAVPRLREVEGMGVTGWQWFLRFPDGRVGEAMDRYRAESLAESLNRLDGPGHHAVRLAVVEVATPTEEKDDV